MARGFAISQSLHISFYVCVCSISVALLYEKKHSYSFSFTNSLLLFPFRFLFIYFALISNALSTFDSQTREIKTGKKNRINVLVSNVYAIRWKKFILCLFETTNRERVGLGCLQIEIERKRESEKVRERKRKNPNDIVSHIHNTVRIVEICHYIEMDR